MIYRSTPLQCGYSPAEKLFGRKIKTRVPICTQQLKPNWSVSQIQAADRLLKEKKKHHYDVKHRVKSLPPVESGTKVWIKTPGELQKGEIREQLGDRSYKVQTETGLKRRNRSRVENSQRKNQLKIHVARMHRDVRIHQNANKINFYKF